MESMGEPRRVLRVLPAIARRARSAWARFVYAKCTSAEIIAFEGSDRFISFVFISHFNKSEAAETARFFIVNEFD